VNTFVAGFAAAAGLALGASPKGPPVADGSGRTVLSRSLLGLLSAGAPNGDDPAAATDALGETAPGAGAGAGAGAVKRAFASKGGPASTLPPSTSKSPPSTNSKSDVDCRRCEATAAANEGGLAPNSSVPPPPLMLLLPPFTGDENASTTRLSFSSTARICGDGATGTMRSGDAYTSSALLGAAAAAGAGAGAGAGAAATPATPAGDGDGGARATASGVRRRVGGRSALSTPSDRPNSCSVVSRGVRGGCTNSAAAAAAAEAVVGVPGTRDEMPLAPLPTPTADAAWTAALAAARTAALLPGPAGRAVRGDGPDDDVPLALPSSTGCARSRQQAAWMEG